MNTEHLNKAIDKFVEALLLLKSAIQTDNTSTKTAPLIAEPTISALSVEDDMSTFDQIKKALYSDRWPTAVTPHLICDLTSETEKQERGQGIIDVVIEDDLKGLRFLDYGCGEGYTIPAVLKNDSAFAVGYDVKVHDWEKLAGQNTLFTTNFENVIANGPYDIILMYDVIDHLTNENPVSVLNKLKNLLTPTGKIYIRCHPYIARHATHLYYELNKAFVHLVLTESELRSLNIKFEYEEPNIGIIYPLATYGKFFEESGLKVLSKREIKDQVEAFFKIPKIAERIIFNTKSKSFPEFQMGFLFIDYCLTK